MSSQLLEAAAQHMYPAAFPSGLCICTVRLYSLTELGKILVQTLIDDPTNRYPRTPIP